MRARVGAADVPRRGRVLAGAAALAAALALLLPEQVAEYRALAWLLALIPPFLLAYYRGWRGTATALSLEMAAFTVVQVLATRAGRPIPAQPFLLLVLATYVAIAFGVGLLFERLHRERRRALQLALTDELTGLPNRRSARASLADAFRAAQRGQALTVILFDLDGFKQYNDRHGHAAGDTALAAFGAALQAATGPADLSARYGGEEFLALLTSARAADPLGFVRRVDEALHAFQPAAGPVTASVGVAAYRAGLASADELLAEADRALYRAKARGGDCVCFADETPGALRLDPVGPAPAEPALRRAGALG